MGEPTDADGALQALVGQAVILDVKAPIIYIGTLTGIGTHAIALADADVHPYSDSQTTTELYLVETKKNGVRPNRTVVYVMREHVVSISRLDDVILY